MNVYKQNALTITKANVFFQSSEDVLVYFVLISQFELSEIISSIFVKKEANMLSRVYTCCNAKTRRQILPPLRSPFRTHKILATLAKKQSSILAAKLDIQFEIQQTIIFHACACKQTFPLDNNKRSVASIIVNFSNNII